MSYPVRAPQGLPSHLSRAPYMNPGMVPVPLMPMQTVYRPPGAPLLPAPVGVPQKMSNSMSAPGTTPPPGKKHDLGEGPPVTVFIGNITGKAPDTMIRYILTACGPVLSWKRVASFGFCEFSSPEAGLRCVRLLHDRQLGDKKLVAKVDEKTKHLLEHYKSEQRLKKTDSTSPKKRDDREDGEAEPEEDYMDEQQRAVDTSTLIRIEQILAEYQDEINNFEAIQLEEQIEKRNKILEDADIEEEKRDVIHREIGKFREIMKVQSVAAI